MGESKEVKDKCTAPKVLSTVILVKIYAQTSICIGSSEFLLIFCINIHGHCIDNHCQAQLQMNQPPQHTQQPQCKTLTMEILGLFEENLEAQTGFKKGQSIVDQCLVLHYLI